MKNLIIILTYVLAVTGKITAQSIDLRTGVDVNGNLVTTLPATDQWQVAGPYATQGTLPSSGFTAAKITNNFRFSAIGPPISYQFPTQPYTPTVAWLSPWVNASSAADYPGNPGAGAEGYYAWRRIFNIPQTCVQSADLNLKLIGVDNFVTGIFMNGFSIPIPSINMWYTSGLVINVPVQYLNIGQQNILLIETANSSEWSTMLVNGTFDFRCNCCLVDFAIRDKERIEKPEFCLEEDVFLDVMGSGITQYQISSQNMNTGITSWSALFNGGPTHVNLTTIFHNYYSPGVPIKVTLYATTSCGAVVIEKTYKFKCCANSANAMFTSVVKNGVLSAQAIGGASHDWKIYTLSPATGQVNNPYPQLDNLERITKTGSYCYLVTHEVNNACGADCKSQRICEKECSASNNPCVPNAPANAQFNNTNWTFSWNPVIGAASYFLEITECDPACCPINDGGPKSAGGCVYPTGTAFFNPTRSKNVFGNTYVLNPADFSWINAPRCFSWRVYAVCENGKRGEPSSNCATTY